MNLVRLRPSHGDQRHDGRLGTQEDRGDDRWGQEPSYPGGNGGSTHQGSRKALYATFNGCLTDHHQPMLKL